jgi:putative FmdB family regulatory protein
MPTYEYACKSCDEHLEVVQSFKDDPLTVCPHCGGPLRKVFGSIGIMFKGSGFYKTDTRKEPKSESAAASASSDAKKTSADTTTAAAKASSGDSGSSGDSASSTKAAAS